MHHGLRYFGWTCEPAETDQGDENKQSVQLTPEKGWKLN